jgi:uncharacterized membrane protein (UPF0127 family)
VARRLVVLLAAAAALAPHWALAGTAALPLSAFPRERIAVETRSARRHLFEAWRAETAEELAQGLMFVESLQPDQAMIFVYGRPQPVTMWMKNTLIPLDMLFVDDGGCVVKVHERARPGDLTAIVSGSLVVLVVELAGGTAAALSLASGDRVVRLDADWPRAPKPCTRPR